MFSPASKIVGLVVLLLAGVGVMTLYRDHAGPAARIAVLQEEKQQLEQIVTRLGAERRVADLIVTHQQRDAAGGSDGVGGGVGVGTLRTTLLFVEYAKTGEALPAKSFTVAGDTTHIDALVVQFDRDLVKAGDPLRGHSVCLFTKIYGDRQAPADAPSIDPVGQVPDVYRNADARVTEFEQSLWTDFWRLTTDKPYAAEKGVRIANGQGVWGPLEPGRLYTLAIESDGGLHLTSEPIKGIYKEAMKQVGPQ